MSAQDLQDLATEYITRLAFAYEYKIPYTIVVDRCRRGELAVHYVEGKTLINVAEALKACERKRQKRAPMKDLFTAA